MAFARINFIQREEIVEKYKAGKTTRELGEEYGIAPSTVSYIVAQAGAVRQRKKPVDTELAESLRKEYEAGHPASRLARKYKMTPQRVADYIREAGGIIKPRGLRFDS